MVSAVAAMAPAPALRETGCRDARGSTVRPSRARLGGPGLSPTPGLHTRVWDQDVPKTRPLEVHQIVASAWKLSIGLAPTPETWFWLGFLACFLGGTGCLVLPFLFVILLAFVLFCLGCGFCVSLCPPCFASPCTGMWNPRVRAGGG